jgi:hypothetical protein
VQIEPNKQLFNTLLLILCQNRGVYFEPELVNLPAENAVEITQKQRELYIIFIELLLELSNPSLRHSNQPVLHPGRLQRNLSVQTMLTILKLSHCTLLSKFCLPGTHNFTLSSQGTAVSSVPWKT